MSKVQVILGNFTTISETIEVGIGRGLCDAQTAVAK